LLSVIKKKKKAAKLVEPKTIDIPTDEEEQDELITTKTPKKPAKEKEKPSPAVEEEQETEQGRVIDIPQDDEEEDEPVVKPSAKPKGKRKEKVVNIPEEPVDDSWGDEEDDEPVVTKPSAKPKEEVEVTPDEEDELLTSPKVDEDQEGDSEEEEEDEPVVRKTKESLPKDEEESYDEEDDEVLVNNPNNSKVAQPHTRYHFPADGHENHHDRFLAEEDYRTVSGKPEDAETLRTFPRHADNAPQREERTPLRGLRLVPDGLPQRHHQGDEPDDRNGRRQEKEDIGEVRIRPRFVHILPALRQCLPARCHYVRPELRACRIRPQQTGTDAEPSGQSRRREEETRRSPA
jgi:hypothetical protein